MSFSRLFIGNKAFCDTLGGSFKFRDALPSMGKMGFRVIVASSWINKNRLSFLKASHREK